ncbi:hypothetical protein B0H10DRAFT_2207777 [Mycena sp. CBHHK59/15]|nr:hypothetical protein B0H10DRAFT_2207777 [Mycena sp. CBHHK59/15]
MAILVRLLAQKPFQCLTGFINAMFCSFALCLHNFYGMTMDALHDWDKTLMCNFNAAISVFSSVTLNFGPKTITFPHVDFVF